LGVAEDRASGPAAALPRDRRPPGAWGQRAAHPEPSAGRGQLPFARAATGRRAPGPATFPPVVNGGTVRPGAEHRPGHASAPRTQL